MKIGSMVIDCNDFAEMLAFWQEALHYVPGEPAPEGDWVVLHDPDGRGVNVSLQQEKSNGYSSWGDPSRPDPRAGRGLHRP